MGYLFIYLFLFFLIFICSGFCHTLKWNNDGFTCVRSKLQDWVEWKINIWQIVRTIYNPENVFMFTNSLFKKLVFNTSLFMVFIWCYGERNSCPQESQNLREKTDTYINNYIIIVSITAGGCEWTRRQKKQIIITIVCN